MTSLQTGREGKGLNHHDEHLFIVVHQAFELWFKQILFELNWIRESLESIVLTESFPFVNPKQTIRLRSYESFYEDFTQTSVLRLLVHRLQRADSIMHIATHGFSAMETMETMDFLEFRDFLIPASGFQSLQMRQLEIVFGIPEKERIMLNGQPYMDQFKTEVDDFTPELRRCLDNITLKEAVYTCLAHLNIPDRDAFADSFLKQRRKEYEHNLSGLQDKEKEIESKLSHFESLNYERISELYNETNGIEQFLRGTLGIEYYLSQRLQELDGLSHEEAVKKIGEYIEHDKSLYQSILNHTKNTKDDIIDDITSTEAFFNSEEYIIDDEKARKNKFKNFTLGQMRKSALYLFSNPWTQPNWDQFECSDWSLFLSTLLKMEQAIALWRSRHARMVELMIGRRQGTGGTSGVGYLDATGAYRAYGDLWTIRAMLISTSSNEYKQHLMRPDHEMN